MRVHVDPPWQPNYNGFQNQSTYASSPDGTSVSCNFLKSLSLLFQGMDLHWNIFYKIWRHRVQNKQIQREKFMSRAVI